MTSPLHLISQHTLDYLKAHCLPAHTQDYALDILALSKRALAYSPLHPRGSIDAAGLYALAGTDACADYLLDSAGHHVAMLVGARSGPYLMTLSDWTLYTEFCKTPVPA